MFAWLAVLAAAVSGPTWKTYVNVQYGYSACYPSQWKAGPVSGSGDGRVFSGPAGGTFSVWGEHNLDGHSPEAVAAAQAATSSDHPARVEYRAAKANWAVVSGTNGARIFYVKVLSRADDLLVMRLDYPKVAAAQYDAATQKISRCFTAGSAPF